MISPAGMPSRDAGPDVLHLHDKGLRSGDRGKHCQYVEEVPNGSDSTAMQAFAYPFRQNPDSMKFYRPGCVFQTEGIRAELRRLSDGKTQGWTWGIT